MVPTTLSINPCSLLGCQAAKPLDEAIGANPCRKCQAYVVGAHCAEYFKDRHRWAGLFLFRFDDETQPIRQRRYLSLAPNRFWKQLSSLSPTRLGQPAVSQP